MRKHRYLKTFSLLILVTILLFACRPAVDPAQSIDEGASGPTSSEPYPAERDRTAPAKKPVEDEGPEKEVPSGPVTINEMGLVVQEDPHRVEVNLVGTLPTPCHRLEWEVLPLTEKGRINVKAVAFADPGQNCIQVIEPFDQGIPLTGMEPGEYEVYVNGERVGSVSFPAN